LSGTADISATEELVPPWGTSTYQLFGFYSQPLRPRQAGRLSGTLVFEDTIEIDDPSWTEAAKINLNITSAKRKILSGYTVQLMLDTNLSVTGSALLLRTFGQMEKGLLE
jgi:hypothetical protein